MNLAGLAERVIQIAGMRPDEGVPVRTYSVPSSDDSSRGYLFVRVFPSPRAPHMVDNKYYGRTDKTNRPLSNAEVNRLIEQRVSRQRDILADTRAALKDFFAGAHELPPMVAVLAVPTGGYDDDPLVPLTELDDRDRRTTVLGLVNAAALPEHQQHFAPTFREASRVVRRAGGVAVTTHMQDDDFLTYELAAEIRLNETGTVFLASRTPVVVPEPGRPLRILESLIIGHTDLVVRMTSLLSERYGFAGAWRFGLVVTGVRGAISNILAHRRGSQNCAPHTPTKCMNGPPRHRLWSF